jgi:protein-tyrosine-phosphatase
LVSLEGEKIVASFPYHSFDLFRVMYKTKHKSLMPNYARINERDYYKENFEYKYAYVDLMKLNEVAEFTGLNICIIQLAALKNEGFDDWSIPDGWKKIKVAEEKYLVIERI